MRLIRYFIDERLVIAVILLNAVSLFLGDYEYGSAQNPFWSAVDYGCVIYFVVETAIKIGVAGWRGYWRNNWNKFDFVIIVISAPALATPWVALSWSSNFTVLRLLRLFRLFRLFRFIPGRDHLAAGIVRSLKASVGVMLGVILVNVIMALGAVVLFGGGGDDPYFGTPWKACFSMFQVFTVEGWYEVPNHIADQTDSEAWGAFARVYFVLAVFGGGILGLSLVNAVFVDQMTADNTDPLEDRIDRIMDELRSLRAEVRALHGLPPGAEGDRAGDAAGDTGPPRARSDGRSPASRRQP
jgi:voltage-gated sodium channel